MKVLLLKAVPKIGKKDDIVEVSMGFANNALFPKKLAVPATQTVVDAVHTHQQNVAAVKEIQHNLLDRAITALTDAQTTFPTKANNQGNLFSKIDAKDIALHLEKNHRITIAPECIHVPDGAIKKVGEYVLEIKDGKYHSSIKLIVIPA